MLALPGPFKAKIRHIVIFPKMKNCPVYLRRPWNGSLEDLEIIHARILADLTIHFFISISDNPLHHQKEKTHEIFRISSLVGG